MSYECPRCSGPLRPVINRGPLNDDQFDSIKAGDFYCTSCKSESTKSGYTYFWTRELEAIKAASDEGIDYEELDHGVQGTVQWLRQVGFETVDSGDGITKATDPDYGEDEFLPYPHIAMLSTPTTLVRDADRLMAALEERGVNFDPVDPETDPAIEASYSPVDGHAVLMLMNVDDKLLGLEGTV